MIVASWNVNSIRVRLQHLLDWMQQAQPDVVCLQELKLETDKFPFDEIGEAGYEAAAYGQQTYNGVAILSRLPIAWSRLVDGRKTKTALRPGELFGRRSGKTRTRPQRATKRRPRRESGQLWNRR